MNLFQAPVLNDAGMAIELIETLPCEDEIGSPAVRDCSPTVLRIELAMKQAQPEKVKPAPMQDNMA